MGSPASPRVVDNYLEEVETPTLTANDTRADENQDKGSGSFY